MKPIGSPEAHFSFANFIFYMMAAFASSTVGGFGSFLYETRNRERIRTKTVLCRNLVVVRDIFNIHFCFN